MPSNALAETLDTIHDYALELLASGDRNKLEVGLQHIVAMARYRCVLPLPLDEGGEISPREGGE